MKPAMIEHNPFLTLPELSVIQGLVHGFGTREMTVETFRRHPQLEGFRPVVMRQVHSDIIHVIDDVPEETLVGDALITRTPGILICVRTADCLPLLIADRESGLSAAVHCGWKGTSRRLASKVVGFLVENLRCSPGSLLAAMGPAIGRDRYEVGEDVAAEFGYTGERGPSFFTPQRTGKYLLDLKLANRIQLEEAGIPRGQIYSLDICTHGDPRLYSYRKDRNECGRLLNFIGHSR